MIKKIKKNMRKKVMSKKLAPLSKKESQLNGKASK
jgi:hypothetical protein